MPLATTRAVLAGIKAATQAVQKKIVVKTPESKVIIAKTAETPATTTQAATPTTYRSSPDNFHPPKKLKTAKKITRIATTINTC